MQAIKTEELTDALTDAHFDLRLALNNFRIVRRGISHTDDMAEDDLEDGLYFIERTLTEVQEKLKSVIEYMSETEGKS